MENISDVEVKAEVFRVIRANSDKPATTVSKLINEHLKNTTSTPEQIKKAIKELKNADCFI